MEDDPIAIAKAAIGIRLRMEQAQGEAEETGRTGADPYIDQRVCIAAAAHLKALKISRRSQAAAYGMSKNPRTTHCRVVCPIGFRLPAAGNA